MATKLTKAQKVLLGWLEPRTYTELETCEHRTARALERKGLVQLQVWGTPEIGTTLAAMPVPPEEESEKPAKKAPRLTKAQKKLLEEVQEDEQSDDDDPNVYGRSWTLVESYREVQTALALERKGLFEVTTFASPPKYAYVRTVR